MRLTRDEILALLAELSYEVVVEPSDAFPFRVTKKVRGYRDGERGALQAKLSMMLQMTGGRKGDD